MKAVEITWEKIREQIRGSDIVVDAMDYWKTRFIIHERCAQEISSVYAGMYAWSAQMTTALLGNGPFQCCVIRAHAYHGAHRAANSSLNSIVPEADEEPET